MKSIFFIFFLLFIPALCFAYSESVYNCGKGSTAIVTHPNIAADLLTINGVQTMTRSGDVNLSFQCYSSLTVGCTDGVDYRVVIIPIGETTQELTYRQIASFAIGAMAAMAFVLSSRSDL